MKREKARLAQNERGLSGGSGGGVAGERRRAGAPARRMETDACEQGRGVRRGAFVEARVKRTREMQPATFEATGSGIETGHPMGLPVRRRRAQESRSKSEGQVSQWLRSAGESQ